jgi:hypothetical protein
MADEIKFPSDGVGTNRPEDSKGEESSKSTQAGGDANGSNGSGKQVESVAEKSAQKDQKEDKKLLLKVNQFRDQSIDWFIHKARIKYDLGQIEHGGFLPADVVLNDLEDEIIDLWFYYQAIKYKIWALSDDQAKQAFTGSRGKKEDQAQQ